MLRRLSTRITVSIACVLGLALLSSTAALVSAWQVGRTMVGAIHDNLPSFQAADDLEVALLEQRGLISSFILDDGNPKWTEELRKKKPSFDECYAVARKTAILPEEFEILDELLAAYRRYDAKRSEVVRVFESGDADAARRMLFREVLPLHREADRLSRRFKAANTRIINEATATAAARVARDTRLVAGAVALTLVAGGALVWQFIVGVVRPVRRMLVEARGFEPGPSSGVAQDELHAVGAYLRLLMSHVSDARTTLEKSRVELSNAEKLASVGKLAASVAHEIRNPLTALKMWLYWIREQTPAQPEVHEAFEVVWVEVGRLESIVRNFLEFTRPPDLEPQPCDVREALDLTLHLMSPRLGEGGVAVTRRYDEALPKVWFDPRQLKQVLINLLDNALQAMPGGGAIELGASTEREPGGAEAVVVRIRDSGAGVAADVAERIFEPFYSTKDHGTGLGLCIAANIMARHGGRLALEPSASGACFTLHFSRSQIGGGA